MALLGSILKSTIELRRKKLNKKINGAAIQKKTLKRLLWEAENTAFGTEYGFSRILAGNNLMKDFASAVPIHDYNSIFSRWWFRVLNGETFVTWPGRVKYFALSSGTSESSSKYIPVTEDILRSIRKTSIRQIFSLAHYNLPPELFQKGILMLGGSTHLNYNGTYFEGDLSGITAGNLPFWFQHFYKPGKRISRERDWNTKLEDITKNADKWDIGIIVGVPAWIQIIMERIIDHYKVKTIHDVWPNLSIYVHGGVSFTPYKTAFEKLLARPLIYIETYLASEGFIAYQDRPNTTSMSLVLDNGIYFEFVPFNEKNFESDGSMVEKPETLSLDQVEEGKEYAILLSTCAGAWRYLIGDTIKFTDLGRYEIVITGRTKHFLSLCGEHLSVDNMNKAVKMVADSFNIAVKEFTVAGIPYYSLFAHKWYIGADEPVDAALFRKRLDDTLKVLNDDYRVERSAALREVFLEIVPTSCFYKWMKLNGKEGGQNKFPRVMKKSRFEEWEKFVEQERLSA
jgi:hypothetical protein